MLKQFKGLVFLNHSQNFPSVLNWIKFNSILQFNLITKVPASYLELGSYKTETERFLPLKALTFQTVGYIPLAAVGGVCTVYFIWEREFTHLLSIRGARTCQGPAWSPGFPRSTAQSLHLASCWVSDCSYDARRVHLTLLPSWSYQRVCHFLTLLLSPPRVRRRWRHSFPWLFACLTPLFPTPTNYDKERILVQFIHISH